MTAKASRVEMPSDIARDVPLNGADYTFACRIERTGADEGSAEQWARDIFGSAPRPLYWFIIIGWIAFVRLRLGPRSSPEYVAGWTIESSNPESVVLAADSGAATNRLVIRVGKEEVVHATFIRFERPIGRIRWAVTGPIHQLTIPYLMRRAARSAG
jgi:hypothetical protein